MYKLKINLRTHAHVPNLLVYSSYGNTPEYYLSGGTIGYGQRGISWKYKRI